MSKEPKFTLKILRQTVAKMRQHEVKPFTVRTKTQAARMRKIDPFGHKWVVGEKYYKIHGGRFVR